MRIVLFVMTPTMFGVENTILYIPNGLFGAAFDGWPTFIAFAAGCSPMWRCRWLTPPAPLRGLDIQVAQDVDDALADPDRFEREAAKVSATCDVMAGGGDGGDRAHRAGATADHGTVSTPSRRLRRGDFTGQPFGDKHFHHRTPPHPRPEHAVTGDAGPRAIGGRSSALTGWPGTLWWISTLGSRSARSDGRSMANGSHASVRLTLRGRVEQHPAASPADLVAGPVDDQPA